MQSIPNIRKFLLGAGLLGAAILGQVSLRSGAAVSSLLAGAPLLLSAAAFAALLRRPLAQPQPRLAPPMNWRDWDVRVVAALVGAALVLSMVACAILDVAAPSARFWNLYAAALGLAVAAPMAALVMERRRGRRAVAWPWLAALGGIVALAALVRLVHLAVLPFGLWYDEAANGLEALRLLNEPHYRPVYTDGVNATGHYLFLVAAALKWFGVNARSIRLVSALMGMATVAATYLAARELFSETVALAAAALMAVARWAINFSRLGMYNISTPLFELLTVGFLLRALRRNRAADFALAGLSLGLGLCFYPAFQLFAAAVGLFLALGLASRRLSLRRTAFGLALMVACAFIVIAPVAKFATEKPDLYFSRVQGTSLFSDKTASEWLPALGANLRKHLLMFNVRGDPNGRHNLPGEPMLDPITAALFVVGIALSLARRRQPVYLLLPAWLLVALLGGILSLDFEAPQSLRSIGALPPAVLLAAFPLHALEQEWASGGGKWTRTRSGRCSSFCSSPSRSSISTSTSGVRRAISRPGTRIRRRRHWRRSA